MMLLIVIAVVTATLMLCAVLISPYKYKSSKVYKSLEGIPGPKGRPIFGSIHEILVSHKELLPKLIEMSETYGSIFKLWLLGNLGLFLTDPNDIEVILNNNQQISKSYSYRFLHPWLGTGLLTSTGSKWHSRRKILTPTFHFKILEDYIEVFNTNSTVLAQRLAETTGTEVNINKYMTLCTLDIICETAMGTSVHAQQGGGKEYIQAVKRMGELFQDRSLAFWTHNDFIFQFTSMGREQKKVLKVLHDFTEGMIQQRREAYRKNKKDLQNLSLEGNRKRLTFLDLLIEISETDGVLSDLDIREEVDTFMFEGHDTTAAAISWAVFLLGHSTDVQEKVFAECDAIFGDDDRLPTMTDLMNMTYLDRVIKEVLRLYPSVPAISRTLDSEVNIRGFKIPAGSNVPIIPYILHRNPALFPDPETFNPDNFLTERHQGRHPFAYLPFSAGPRNCIGQRFARLEEKAVLSALVRKFTFISLDKREDVKLMMEMILRPKSGLRMQFTPRV